MLSIMSLVAGTDIGAFSPSPIPIRTPSDIKRFDTAVGSISQSLHLLTLSLTFYIFFQS